MLGPSWFEPLPGLTYGARNGFSPEYGFLGDSPVYVADLGPHNAGVGRYLVGHGGYAPLYNYTDPTEALRHARELAGLGIPLLANPSPTDIRAIDQLSEGVVASLFGSTPTQAQAPAVATGLGGLGLLAAGVLAALALRRRR